MSRILPSLLPEPVSEAWLLLGCVEHSLDGRRVRSGMGMRSGRWRVGGGIGIWMRLMMIDDRSISGAWMVGMEWEWREGAGLVLRLDLLLPSQADAEIEVDAMMGVEVGRDGKSISIRSLGLGAVVVAGQAGGVMRMRVRITRMRIAPLLAFSLLSNRPLKNSNPPRSGEVLHTTLPQPQPQLCVAVGLVYAVGVIRAHSLRSLASLVRGARIARFARLARLAR